MDVKIIKKLNAGFYGTTYLCSYKGKQYALKIQNILEKDVVKDLTLKIWREIDLHEYVDTLPKNEQLFFTKLYKYEICDDCDHVQVRPFKINDNIKKIKELDKSKWCIKFLLEYKGKFTLSKYFVKTKLSQAQIYSIILQIINIVKILKDGGYSHRDLHTNNIMICETDKDSFNLYNKKIKYNGLQVCAIDYGSAIHKKSCTTNEMKEKFKKFLTDNDTWVFDELYDAIIDVIKNLPYTEYCCKKLNKKCPFERKKGWFEKSIKIMFDNHIDWCSENVKKYIKIFPKGSRDIKRYLKTCDIQEIKNHYEFYNIINRLCVHFNLEYPKLYTKYFDWCCETRWMLPKEQVLQFLLLNNSKSLIDFFINIVK